MKNILIIICGLFIVMSCTVGGQWNEENIDPKIKAEIRDLNNSIVEGLATRNAQKIRSVASDKLLGKSIRESLR